MHLFPLWNEILHIGDKHLYIISKILLKTDVHRQ
jgi:hypothetical protein